MKILQINTECNMASPGRIAKDLYKLLEEHGNECAIAYGRGDAPDDIKTIKIGNSLDIYSHLLKTRVLDKQGFGSYSATKKLIKDIKEYNPDIIHLHNLHGYYINIHVLFNYLKEANKPVIWTLHDCWAFTGHCAYFDYIRCNKWKEKCYECQLKGEYPSSKLFDHSALNYIKKRELFTSIKNMTIVTPSKWLADLVKQSFLGKYSVKVINNGIDLSIFKRINNNLREKYNLKDKFIILGVANVWNERKGIKYFYELSNKLDDSFKIILVGLNEKQLKELPSNILGITRTKNIIELAEIYNIADVFVNPTLEDNFPTTNLEALACGTPVITFNTGGSVECINNECGIVVEKNDLKKLIKVIIDLKYKNLDSKSCIKKGSVYNKKIKYSNYLTLYNNYRR